MFKDGLMHPGLALVAEMSGSLGDFPSLSFNFFGQNTNLGVRSNGYTFGYVHYTQKWYMLMICLWQIYKKDLVEYNFPS